MIIGGPGAWQLEHVQSIGKLGADVLFNGEAGIELPEIIDEIQQSSKIDEDHRIIHAHYIPESAFLPIASSFKFTKYSKSRGDVDECANFVFLLPAVKFDTFPSR